MLKKIFVRAKPLSKEEGIEEISSGHFVVAVKEPPKQGLANKAIIKALAGYFNVAFFKVRLVSGFASRQKIFEISD